jgi:hypothetical protein
VSAKASPPVCKLVNMDDFLDGLEPDRKSFLIETRGKIFNLISHYNGKNRFVEMCDAAFESASSWRNVNDDRTIDQNKPSFVNWFIPHDNAPVPDSSAHLARQYAVLAAIHDRMIDRTKPPLYFTQDKTQEIFTYQKTIAMYFYAAFRDTGAAYENAKTDIECALAAVETDLASITKKNWPPFPLPDVYDSDDPDLISEALFAIRKLRNNFDPKLPFFGRQLKCAIDVALDIRLSYPELPQVPLASNLEWPVERDFIELEQWYCEASVYVKAEIAKNKAEMAKELASLAQSEPVKEPVTQSEQQAMQVSIANAREQKWDDHAPGYITATEALKLIDNKYSLPWLNKELKKPQCAIRFMCKGQRRKLNLIDFREYVNKNGQKSITDEAIEKYMQGVESRKKVIKRQKQAPK